MESRPGKEKWSLGVVFCFLIGAILIGDPTLIALMTALFLYAWATNR